ncbi:EAL domain-containing protein [Ruminococcaceae bacterium OttesenSCG-928-D13]|nr:EAL domain-containing protein [Ruminococcaceae bacterium OttesenSCG-928-D13]
MSYSMGPYQDYLRAIPAAGCLADDLEEICKGDGAVGFLCYDIHSLRKINRAYGRKVGDALLASVAEWTRGFPGSALYRVESDQFCLLFENTDAGVIRQYAFDMESRFGKPWKLTVDGRDYDVFAQAAIAVLGDFECAHRNELLELLDQALDISRKERQVILFTTEHDRLTREQVRLQMELKSCMLSEMQGFHLVFQPLTDPVTSTWRGVEALCRWAGPTIGPVPPGIFVAEIEEMGLIHQLGVWVLNKAVEICKALHLDEIDRFFVSVNVSALQMNRHNYVRTVLDALEKYQYPAGKLLLEITESTQFSFNPSTMASIEMLRDKGVMFALDDFGTGYSGFSNLKNIPVDMLKTEREFIENIENDTYLQYFYYIMSETAHANKLQLIAEGIETREQLLSVVKNGADLIQGYLFGKPMNAAEIEKSIRNFHEPLAQFDDAMSDPTNFKQWIHSHDAYKITPALFGLQSKCIGTMLDTSDPDEAIEKILEIIGQHFKVNRAYVFLQDEGTIFSNRYEWCAEGVEPQKHLFQQVDGQADDFYRVLCDNEVVIARMPEELPSNLHARLEAGMQKGAIQSMVVTPMKQQGEILGFVGLDDNTIRDWMPEELIILHNLCLFCLIMLAKKENLSTQQSPSS